MWIKVNLQIILKDRPDDYHGLRRVNYRVGRHGPLRRTLSAVVYAVCEAALEMGLIEDTNDLRYQLDGMWAAVKDMSVGTQESN